MDNMDKISLVLATYNGEKYLREQLQSILDSVDAEKIIGEIIITDDGSSDGTEALVHTFMEKNPLISFHKNPNKGVVNNFINGIKLTKYGYVMFCDQDDYWVKTKISVSYNTIREMEKTRGRVTPALAFTDSKVVDVNLNIINESFFKYIGADIENGLSLNKLMVNNVAQGCVMIVNRALIDAVDFSTSPHWVMHDWWMILIASMHKNICAIKEPLLLYRQHDNNVFGAKRNTLIKKFTNLGKTYLQYKKSAFKIMKQNVAFRKSYPQSSAIVNDFSSGWYIKNESSVKRKIFALLCIREVMDGINR